MSAEPTTHDPEDHSSFIKSPRQLITLVVLAFAVPTVLIILVARTVVSARSPSPAAMTPEAIAERIRPVADVAIAGQTRPEPATAAKPTAAATAKAAPQTGEQVYNAVCAACHQAGVANAPKFGDKSAWTPRLAAGIDTLYANSIKGKGAMPPKGGQLQLADAAVRAAVDYMVAAVK